jgi:hypothetical protein
MKRALSVRLSPPGVGDVPSMSVDSVPSYVLGDGAFVKDDVAVFECGVAMKDAARHFVVQPESLALGEVIGRGACAYVQRAVHVPTGRELVLKVISVFDRSKRHQLITEIQALYESDCDALISFLGAFYRDGAISIALEYMDAGPLSNVVTRCGALPESVLAAVAFQDRSSSCF